MSDELQVENENLKKQALQNSQGIQGLLAQVDAYKQLVNENTQISINLRTNLILFQKASEELSGKVSALNKQLEEAKARIVELEPKS